MIERARTSWLGASWYLYYAWVDERNPAQALAYVRAAGAEPILNPFPRQVEVDAAMKWASNAARQ